MLNKIIKKKETLKQREEVDLNKKKVKSVRISSYWSKIAAESLSYRVAFVSVILAVFVQVRLVTDRRTDRQTDRQTYRHTMTAITVLA